MIRRCLAVALTAAVALVLHASPAAALEPAETGWWWAAQPGGTPAPVPAPPTVPADGLMVGGDPTGPNAIAALHFVLDPGQGKPVLTLHVADNGDVGGAGAILLACRPTSVWGTTYAGAWGSRPSTSCANAVHGVRSTDGTTWTFDLKSLLSGREVQVALVPDTGSTFTLAFKGPGDDAVRTTAVAGASATPALDLGPASADAPVPDAAPVADLGLAPLEAPAAPAPGTPTVSLVTPSRPRALAAPAAARSAPTRRVSGLAILLILVVAALALRLDRVPAPPDRVLGPLTARPRPTRSPAATEITVGGLGRFARPRTGDAPKL